MIQIILTHIVIIFLVIVLVLYSSRIETIYPSHMQKISQEPLYRLIFLLVIVLLTEYNLPIAILAAILFMFMIHDVSILSKVNEGFLFGPAVNTCDIYKKEDIEKDGGPFYPIN